MRLPWMSLGAEERVMQGVTTGSEAEWDGSCMGDYGAESPNEVPNNYLSKSVLGKWRAEQAVKAPESTKVLPRAARLGSSAT